MRCHIPWLLRFLHPKPRTTRLRPKIEVALVRVDDPNAGPVWLISSTTLAEVPLLGGALDRSWIERATPKLLAGREAFGISLAHWTVLAASLVVPFILLTLIFAGGIAITRRVSGSGARRRELDAWYEEIRWPAIAALTLTVQLLSMPLLGFPLTFRMAYAHIGLLAAVIAFAWVSRRLLTLGFARARRVAWGEDPSSTQSLMLLGERLLKALIVIVAAIAILLIVGVDAKTALAAFGIVGVALALGAQRTVENVLGGVFMLSDRAIAVGDLCSISNRLGWIEDITLRTRFPPSSTMRR